MGDERTQAAHHREELIWAAGLWDGEGSCGVYERKDARLRAGSQWSIRCTVHQNHDPEVLHRFGAAVGIEKVYGPYQSPTGDRYAFQVTGKKALAVLDAIMPWLSGPKRRQAEAALAEWHSRELRKGGHVCDPDCTCGRQKWKTQDLDPAVARRREQQREATRRYRAKKEAMRVMTGISVGDLVQVGSDDPGEDGKIYEVTHKGETHMSLRCMETKAEITVPLGQPWVKVMMA